MLPLLAPERRQAMEFLWEHLPQSDLDCYPPSLFLQFADHALRLRREAAWCAALDPEIFAYYVLFPRVNDEDLSFYSAPFHEALWPRICALPTVEEKVLEVNRWCHEHASYQAQDSRTASPLTVFQSGSGRCGEESGFLVAALRSVGIPARQVYVPRWAHCDDNHAWVEALCGDTWRFLGACEPEPVLDRGWFNTSASRAMLVVSRIFGCGASPLHGEYLGPGNGVHWYNQTPRYARTRRYTFRAQWRGCPASGAAFQLQLMNEANLCTLVTLTGDEQGAAEASLGLGDLHVLALWKGKRAEGLCTGQTLTLALEPPAEEGTDWAELEFRAPEAAFSCQAVLDAPQRAERAAVLREGDARRQAWLAGFYRPSGKSPSQERLLRDALGNRAQIAAFLERDGDPRREALLHTLTEKDLRDVQAGTLEDHLQNAAAQGALPEEVYLRYVLCPRVELEPLTPWRSGLRGALTAAQAERFRAEPAALWPWLGRRIRTDVPRSYGNLVWTPAQAWQAGRCNARSLRILYAALLRTLGVPARLRPMDGTPEFWQAGAFRPAGAAPEAAEPTGTLCLTCGSTQAPLYGQNWTLSRRTPEGWQLLSLPDGGGEGPNRTLALPAGHYRLTTSVRLPNGNQFAAMREVALHGGETQHSALHLRSYALEDMLRRQPLTPMPAVTRDGRAVPDLCRMAAGPSLLFWLEEGGEPTEHVLYELAAARPSLEALPVQVVFLLRGAEGLRQPTLANLLAQWPGIAVLWDEWAYDLESVARQLTCDPSTPPLAVACDAEGRAVYGISGYHVGSVELLARVAAHLCRTGRGGGTARAAR